MLKLLHLGMQSEYKWYEPQNHHVDLRFLEHFYI